MVVDWLIYGCIIFGVAKLLNVTAFKLNPASRLMSWILTIFIFIVSVLALSTLKILRYQAISDSVGILIKPQYPIDTGGAIGFAWLFFSTLKRKTTNIQAPTDNRKNSKASRALLDNMDDEKYYEIAGKEISDGLTRQGLWTKALSTTGYNELNAKACYIKLRVETLKREAIDHAVETQRQADEKQQQQSALYKQWKQKNIINCPFCQRIVSPKVQYTTQGIVLICPNCKTEVLTHV